MPGGRFSKQADWFSAKLNANYSDAVIGGALTTSPGQGAGYPQQFQATQPGDRVILSPSDALANSNNNANLYTGTYMYVATQNNSASSPALGHAAFWVDVTGANNSAQDGLYQVTSDEAANFGVTLFAGVYLTALPKGNYWWIQAAGKATCAFRNAISGTPAIGAGVYLAGAGNNNNAVDVGAFDQLAGANAGGGANAANLYATVDAMFLRYVGPAETLPANNNTAIVDITLSRIGWRW